MTVVVPYRPDEERDKVWQWVHARYRSLHPDWQVVTGDHDGAWSKGAALATALRQADSTIVVAADADSFVAANVLVAAVALAVDMPWVMPHRRVHRLSLHATRIVLASEPTDTPNRRSGRSHGAPVGGGIVVARREALEQVPLDPRFQGWGGEDISWGRALDTLIGPHVQLAANLWHLWHAPQPTSHNALPAVEHLAGRYLDATGDTPAMRALLNER